MSIEIKHLSHVYNSDTSFAKKALNNIDLSIATGEFIGLIGHTGSGKSTLIQHLNATLLATEGEILIDGEDLYTDKEKRKIARRKVGLTFQYPEQQLFEMTVYKDVAFGPTNMKLTTEEVDSCVRSALQTVGLSDKVYDQSPFELSGGQKRRVAIAGVLAMNPEILILDEPTAGLDPRGAREILDAIKNLHEKRGITVILVSHSMEDVARFADRLIVMHKGNIAMTGTPREIFSQTSRVEELGLRGPQMSYVFAALKKKGMDVPQDVFTIEESVESLYKLVKQVKK